MKRILLIAMFLGLICQIAKPAASNNPTVTGSWKCSVNDAPYEYSNSVITFTEKDGKLNGAVKFDSGTEIKLDTVKLTNDQLVLTLYVEGYSVTVDGKVAGNKITGTADTPNGKVNFVATKIEKKK
jgi:hypothetical protein